MLSSTTTFIHNRIVDPVLHTSIGKTAYTKAQGAVEKVAGLGQNAVDFIKTKAANINSRTLAPAYGLLFGTEEEFAKAVHAAKETGAVAGAKAAETKEETKSLLNKLMRSDKINLTTIRQFILQTVVACALIIFALLETGYSRFVKPAVERALPNRVTTTVGGAALQAVEYGKPVGQAVMVQLNKLDQKLFAGAIFKFIDDVIKGMTKEKRKVE